MSMSIYIYISIMNRTLWRENGYRDQPYILQERVLRDSGRVPCSICPQHFWVQGRDNWKLQYQDHTTSSLYIKSKPSQNYL